MATIVAAAGGGNWQTNGTWVGGVKPTAADDAQLDGTSGAVTIDSGAVCRSLDCTGYTNTLTHTAGVTLTIGDATAGLSNIALKLVSGMTYTLGSPTSSKIAFVSSSATQQTVAFGTKTPGDLSFDFISVLFSDGYTNTAATLAVLRGTVNTNGQTLSVGIVTLITGGTLTLGATQLTLAGNLTFSGTGAISAGTSTITLTGSSSVFAGNGKTFNSVVLTGVSPSITGTNTFASLTKNGTAIKTDALTFGASQTISGALTINGDSAINRLLVQSNTVGTARTLTAATVSCSNVDFMDITGAGAGSWNLAAITGKSGDCGGNSGITFTTAATQTQSDPIVRNVSAVSTGTSSLTTNVPAGTLDGYLLVWIISTNASFPSSYAGWTGPFSQGAGGQSAGLFYRTASSEPANYTITGLGAFSTGVMVAMSPLLGGSIQFNAESNSAGDTTTSATVTTTAANAITFYVSAALGNTNFASWNLGGNGLSAVADNANATISLGVGYRVQPSAGSAGSGGVGYTGGSFNNIGLIFSFNPNSAAGNWSDVTKWTSRVPLPQDNVIVDVNTTGTLTADMPRLGKDLAFTGFAGTASFSSTPNSVFGSLTLASGMTVSGTQALTVAGRGSQTLTSAGKTFTQPVTQNGPTGSYTLQDSLTMAGTLTVTGGTFDANTFGLTCLIFVMGNSLGAISMGTGNWTVTQTGGSLWSVTAGTVTASTSTIVLSGVSVSSRTFAGGGETYNHLTWTAGNGNGTLVITGANTFADVNVGRDRIITLPASTTTTVTGSFNVNGTAALPTTLNSSSGGTAATLSKASGAVVCNYLSIQDSTATGGATFRALDSTNVSGNTGWTFVPISGDLSLTPYSDVATNSWTTDTGGTTNLYAAIDETTASDTDYIQSPVGPTTASYYETALETHADPLSSSGHIVHYRYRKNVAGGNVGLAAELRQGNEGGGEFLTVNQQSLETDTTGWGIYLNASLAASSVDAHAGSKSLEITCTSNNTSCGAVTPVAAGGFLVTPGVTYTASAWNRAGTNFYSTKLEIHYWDAGLSPLPTETYSFTPVDTAWHFVTVSGQAPASAVYAGLRVYHVVVLLNDKHYWDEFSLMGPITLWSHTNIPNSWTQQNQTLTGPEADSITDYSDLRLRFTPDMVTSDAVVPVPTKVADRASANSNTAVTTVDLVLTSLTVGNYLIVRSAADNSGGGGAARTMTVSNQSGTAMGTHTEYQQNNDPGAASAGVTCNVSVIKIAATSGTIRLTYSGSVVQACVAEEWSGIHATTPVVGTPVGASGVASTNFASMTDASIALGNVAYGVITVEAPAADTFTQDADTTNGSWVSLTELGTTNATADLNQSTWGAYKTVTATGAQTYNPTGNVARDSAGLILELAAAATPAPTIKAQVSWANLELPASTSTPRSFGAQVGLSLEPLGAVAFGAGDA